jgi:HEAT repeat protein
MNRSLAVGLIFGLMIGLIAGALIGRHKRPPAPTPAPAPVQTPPPPPTVVPAPDPRVETLQGRIAELEAKLAAPPAPPEEPKEAALPEDLETRFGKLAPLREGALGAADFHKLVEQLKKGGAKSIAYLADKLMNSKDPNERFLAAALMGGLGDPAVIPHLGKALEVDEAGMVRRMASNALALMKHADGLPALRAALASDKDWGVRVNSAYGIAKLGQSDGEKALEDLYYSKETQAGYQVFVFGALADVATQASVPFFRKILGEKTELGFQLGAIGVLEKLKVVDAIPDLNRIAGDANYDVSVRDAARKAADSLAR